MLLQHVYDYLQFSDFLIFTCSEIPAYLNDILDSIKIERHMKHAEAYKAICTFFEAVLNQILEQPQRVSEFNLKYEMVLSMDSLCPRLYFRSQLLKVDEVCQVYNINVLRNKIKVN